MTKKYELTNETICFFTHTLHRIKALKDFGNVEAGDLGGWVEHEENLSQEGTCWVYDEAMVFGNAKVFGDALIYGSAMICKNAQVYNNAKVYDMALIYGNAKVFDDAKVFDNARVFGFTKIFTALAKTTDYLCLGPIGSRDDYVTFTKSGNVIYVATGCFKGTLEEFKKAVSQTHKTNRYARQYQNAIDMAEKHFNI